jgi:hypothetical protein
MLQLNLFHEQQQIQKEKDFDPVRLTILGGIFAFVAIVLWAVVLYAKDAPLRVNLAKAENAKAALVKKKNEMGAFIDFPGIQEQANSLKKRIVYRTLFATDLDILRNLVPTNCQVQVFKTSRGFETSIEKVPQRRGPPVEVKKTTPSLAVNFSITTKGKDKVEILQVRDSFLEVLHKDPSLRDRAFVKQVPPEDGSPGLWNDVEVKSNTHEPKGNEKAVGIFDYKLNILMDEARDKAKETPKDTKK